MTEGYFVYSTADYSEHYHSTLAVLDRMQMRLVIIKNKNIGLKSKIT
jgi:hypothetical protein